VGIGRKAVGQRIEFSDAEARSARRLRQEVRTLDDMDFAVVKKVKRAIAWPRNVNARHQSAVDAIQNMRAEIAHLSQQHAALVAQLSLQHQAAVAQQGLWAEHHIHLAQKHDTLARCLDVLRAQHESLRDVFLRNIQSKSRLLAVRKANKVVLLDVDPALIDQFRGFSASRSDLISWAGLPDLSWAVVAADRQHWPIDAGDYVRDDIRRAGSDADALTWTYVVTSDEVSGAAMPGTAYRPELAASDTQRRRLFLLLGLRDPSLIRPLHDIEVHGETPSHYPPFEVGMPFEPSRSVSVPATPKKRSVLFVNPAYYNFRYLADSLRKRGWDAVAMGIIDPASDYARHFHGHDWNLFDPDPEAQLTKLQTAFHDIVGRFDMVHFHGMGNMSFFPYNYDTSIDHDRVPWDVLELKRRGVKVAYTITGCQDLTTQTAFRAWSPTTCPRCPWRDVPHVCSDHRLAAWGWKVQQLADLICIETDPPLEYRDTPAVFREPLSFAVDPDFWHPDLARSVPVPEEWREPKKPGEILIYHSVGNYETRTRNGVNAKGTGAVIAAIDRLAAEGHPVRLLFRREVPSIHNRWMLAQSDIIVDQLHYGRYGATGREGMMLGRPVVGHLNKTEARGLPPVRCIAESPIVNATEDTLYAALKRLVEQPEERARIGKQSRAHALQWWSKDVLAERYERVYDHVLTHGRPPLTLDP
jgi:hypothetical protein